MRQEIQTDDRIRTSRQPHRRLLPEELRCAEEAESPLGRLYLAKLLRSREDAERDDEPARDRYNAGTMYAFAVGAYRAVIGAPNGTAGGGRGYPCDTVVCALDPGKCECLRRKARYNNAFEALSDVGRRQLLAVNRVVAHREAIAPEEMVYLIEGLEALVWHFGLTRRRRPEHHRNTN